MVLGMALWQLVTPSGIQVDEPDVWHAGCCVDMVSLGQGNLLVASETGGVWLIDGTYSAQPLSDDWEFPDVICLASSPRFSRHVLAGCRGALYETVATAADPLRSWHSIPLPVGVSTVFRIAIVVEPHRVVVATDAGVWWADVSGNAYNWTEALGTGNVGYSGLALSEGVRPDGNSMDTVVVGVRNAGPGSPGLLRGLWQGPDLSFSPARIGGLGKNEVWSLDTFSLASCLERPRRAYAVAADSDGMIGRVLRSNDGGARWSPCSTILEKNPGVGDIRDKDFSGDRSSGGWQKTISVHFHNPDVVAFGWKHPFLSTNGGKSWRGLGARWTGKDPHVDRNLHDDTHAICFDSTYGTHRLYVLSDGGVAMTDDWSLIPATFKSFPNRQLPTLQFYSPGPPREFWGTISSADFAPLVGGGLQDNSNVCLEQSAQPPPWRRTTGGDGGWFTFIGHAGGQILSNAMGEGVQRGTWGANLPHDDGTIPLENLFGEIDLHGLRGPKAEAVPDPRFKIGNETMYAVGAPGLIFAVDVLRPLPPGLEGYVDESRVDNRYIFGLVGGAKPFLRWRSVGRIPDGAAEITALGADRGDTVYIGTAAGEMFVLDVATGNSRALSVQAPTTGLGAVGRIVLHRGRGPFAMMESGNASSILALDGLRWRPLKSSKPLPDVKLFGLDLCRRPGPVSMAVSADSDVFVSPDDGDTWNLASGGLPRMPHGADIRFGTWDGRESVFLGTWGRSMWVVPVDEPIASGRRRLHTKQARWSSLRDPEIARNRFHTHAP